MNRIIFLLCSLISFSCLSHNDDVLMEARNNDLIVHFDSEERQYTDVFFEHMLSASYLGKFNNNNAIYYEYNSQGPQDYIYTLGVDNKNKKAFIDCNYVNSRRHTGIIYQGVICNLGNELKSDSIGINFLEDKIVALNIDNIDVSSLGNGNKLKVGIDTINDINVNYIYNTFDDLIGTNPIIEIERKDKKYTFSSSSVYLSYDNKYQTNGLLFIDRANKNHKFYKYSDLNGLLEN